jgi:DNA repair protein RadA/Sms
MSKVKKFYVCNKCGYNSQQWLGRCPDCLNWNSFEEQLESKEQKIPVIENEMIPVNLKSLVTENHKRIKIGLSEFDQLIGGGIVEGSVTLIGGEPGIGKSTIMLQIASMLAGIGKKVLYVTSEESVTQVKLRAERLELKSKDFSIISTNAFAQLENIINKYDYNIFIIDSIQTIYSNDIMSPAGTVSQIKYITYKLVEFAKNNNLTIFITGQITKEGYIAGPKVLEHLVDTVLYFEGDYTKGYRILRAIKNRFGPTNMVALFEMREKGLVPLDLTSLYTHYEASGKALTVVMEGSRAIIVEIQSLVAPTFYNYPRRNATGFDQNRLQMLLAILDKRYGFNLSNQDVYVNVAGGLRITETAADLAVCLSIISSCKNFIIPSDVFFLGEVNLSGFVSPISFINVRVEQAKKYGIKKVFLPAKSEVDVKGIKLIKIENIEEAYNYEFI